MVYMYTYIHAQVRKGRSLCQKYACMYVCMYVCMYAVLSVQLVDACIFVCSACVCVCVRVSICACTPCSPYTLTHIHTYTGATRPISVPETGQINRSCEHYQSVCRAATSPGQTFIKGCRGISLISYELEYIYIYIYI